MLPDLGVVDAAVSMGLAALRRIGVFGAFFSYTQEWSSWIGVDVQLFILEGPSDCPP